ncbi:MAG: S41 family peptidase [Polyangiaceae bacterium]
MRALLVRAPLLLAPRLLAPVVLAPLVLAPLVLAGCDGGETTGTGGGTTSSAGGGGTGGADCVVMEAPPALPDTFCDRFPGGAPGEGPVPVDLSRAHALARFWGPVEEYSVADQALAAALAKDEAWSGEDLSGYAGSLAGVACSAPAEGGSLGEATVESLGAVAVVVPGTGPVELPAGTEAVLVDLRGLPWAPGVREAVIAAVSPALAAPVSGLSERVRRHDGMIDEIFSATNVYKSTLVQRDLPDIPASGTADLKLALLTGPKIPGEAVEIAALLRLAGRAWLIGEDLRVDVAEGTWQGVGETGVLVRTRELRFGGGTMPDVIFADQRTASPECFASDILAKEAVPPAGTSATARPLLKSTAPFGDVHPVGDARGDARAGLVIAHGAVRRFFPYFGVVGDGIDERLMETTSSLPAAPSRVETRNALRRFGNVLSDGHNFVYDSKAIGGGFFPVHVESIDGEAVIRRSAAPGVEPGDTIVSIGGVPAAEWYSVELARSGGASPGYQFNIATREMTRLFGPVEFGLESAQGVSKMVTAQPQPVAELIALVPPSSREAGFLGDLGAPEVYYLNMDSTVLTGMADLKAALEEAAGAKGLVVDMRGYPGVNHYDVARRLVQKTFSSPIFLVPELVGPEEVNIDKSSFQVTPQANPSFTGPIALLVGPGTVSAAENFSTMLVDAGRVTTIGRQSASTNGNITGVQLPGGFAFSFTGMDVRHADAEESVFHGTGIVPDIEVAVSAADFAGGVDPEVEAAIGWGMSQ